MNLYVLFIPINLSQYSLEVAQSTARITLKKRYCMCRDMYFLRVQNGEQGHISLRCDINIIAQNLSYYR